jgi:exosortase
VYQAPINAVKKTTDLPWLSCLWQFAPVLALLPLALVGIARITSISDYSMLPFLIALVAWLAMERSKELGQLVAGPLPSAWFMAATLIVMTALSVFAIQRASLLCILLAFVAIGWRLGSWPLVRAWAPALACTVWFIPAPMGWHDLVVRTLQGWAVIAAHHVLVATDVLHAIRGHLIALPGHTLFVSEACSGARMLLLLGALSSLWCVAIRGSALFLTLLLATTIGWVVVINITRIIAIVLALKVGINLSEGWPHTGLGLGLVPLGIILILGTGVLLDWVMTWLQRPKLLEANPVSTVWLPAQQVAWPNWVVAWCGILFVFQSGMAGVVTIREIPSWRASSILLPLLNDALPESMAGWQRISGPSMQESTEMLPLGVRSQQWTYSDGTLAAQISLDDHFPGWHPLNDCYVFMGWQQIRLNEEIGDYGPLMMATYESGQRRHGFLVFGLRSRGGEWIGRPGLVKRYGFALINHLKNLYLGQGVGETEPPTRQLQVFIETRKPLDQDGQRSVVALFESARQNLEPLLWPGESP